MLLFIFALLALVHMPLARGEIFPLSIIHINDFHARYEPTDIYGGTCDPGEECIGGYARTVHMVKRLLEEQKNSNPVFFNAGDSFQGTLWYNIGRYNVTTEFLNMLPADAMTLGNHEFDHGVEGVVPFLEGIDTHMLVANMDSKNEPNMTGKYHKSVILERSGRKIGVIGVILETTYDLANTGKLIFRNESDAIREEAAILKEAGANIIIVISHCGYDVDQKIARNAGSEIDVIVGAHSHTFLYTGDTPPGPDKSRGDYPTEVIHESGHRVLIVQAAAYAKYVGNITVFFDDDGNVVDHSGAPIYMGSNVPEDVEIKAALQPWKEIVDERGKVVVGQTKVELTKSSCGFTECNLGNYFCDAMVHAYADMSPFDKPDWSTVAIGLVNAGALRVPLTRGNLSYAHLVTMSPFENVILAYNLPGKILLEALEYSVRQIDLNAGITSSSIFLQVSGLRITYNYYNPVGKRVVDIKVRCATCTIPKYEQFDEKKTYRIVSPNFLVNGGDGYSMIRDHATDKQGDISDLDSLLAYTDAINPIYTGLESRIVVSDQRNIEVQQALIPWQQLLEEYNRIIGSSAVYLQQAECASGECNLGNFYTDAMLHAFIQRTNYNQKYWSNVSLALTTQGNFRVPLPIGNITYYHLVTMCPWANKLYALTLKGNIIRALLEDGVKPMKNTQLTPRSSRFLQFSGLKVIYNISQTVGERIVDLKIRCWNCPIPKYVDLEDNESYRVVVMEYLANGKNGFNLISDNAKDIEEGPEDLDALIDFMQINNPIIAGLENRIKVLK